MDLDLIYFRENRPTEQKLKQLDRHRLLPKPKLKRLGKAFETFDQLLLRKDDSQRIKECVRSILRRYEVILYSAHRDIEVFKRNNPSKRFEFDSTVELHIVYAIAWCKSCLEDDIDIYSQRQRLHNNAKIEAAKFLESAVRQEAARRELSLPQHSSQIDRIYGIVIIILALLTSVPLGVQEEAPYLLAFASSFLLIKTRFSVFDEKLNENDRNRMINSSILKSYNKIYKCTTKQLLNSLGSIQNISKKS